MSCELTDQLVVRYYCPPRTRDSSREYAGGICEPLLEMEHNSPEYLNALIESLRCVIFLGMIYKSYQLFNPRIAKSCFCRTPLLR